MGVQGIGSRDSWAEFVRLVQEARARNQGLGGAVGKGTGIHNSAHVSPVQHQASHYGIMKNEPAVARTGHPSLTTKICGGFFDAYA